jgi:protoporphyrinogen IX oxidase
MCDSKKASRPSFCWGFFLPAIYCVVLGLPILVNTALAYTRAMLWVKAFHIIFIASWFAGLFYLPRIFVNLAQVQADLTTTSPNERMRLLLMARKLLRFTTLLALPALGLGLWLWLGYGIGRGPGNGWMHAKLAVVLLAVGYHHACSLLLRKFEQDANTRSHVWYRWFNEVPVLLLAAAVVLVVVKPF